MECISWNVHGIDCIEKGRALFKLVKHHKPSFLFLQELNVRSVDYHLVNAFGGRILSKGMIVDAVGPSGGLITLWNEEAFNAKACVNNDRCSIILGDLVAISKEIVICNVYAPNTDDEWVTFSLGPTLERRRRGQDHSAVWLGTTKEKLGPYPVRYFDSWDDHKEVMNSIMEEWKNKMVAGSKGLGLAMKLKAVKIVFKKWQREVKLEDFSLGKMESRLEAIEVRAKASWWNLNLRDDRRKVLADMWSDKIYSDGALCVGPSQVRAGIFGFFKDHFATKCIDRPRLEGTGFAQISTENGMLIEENFSIEEVKEGLDGCYGNKALGLVGFNMNLIKKR
ncbi:hypothetical protein Dsin_009349 [Dipteronia sinensis]|uniref:Endonuclease/exonuclease/phosphatase domain-containing protein n=1 Tax=Dipteronia sinensis TaxID=43782 RepID=A0AAE0EBU7_9ROSI|nr:hypothetical protein Dsin_009349 [Dipteronia sinensis]